MPQRRLQPVGEANLGVVLGLRESRRESRRRRPAAAASRSCVRSVIQPSPIASVISVASVGIGQQQPAARRHAVGLVVEPLGKHLGKIAQPSSCAAARSEWPATPLVLWLPTMARLAMRTLRSPALLDQAHAVDAVVVAGIARPALRQESGD